MPTISLRLTDEEHEQLKTWAHDGRRSVQKELIWRLFTEAPVMARHSVTGQVHELTPADSRPRGVPSRTIAPSYFPEREFKPDPKPERKK